MLNIAHLFGGELRCASVAPAHVDPTSIALVSVSVSNPTHISVWQVFFTETFTSFEIQLLGATTMNPQQGAPCIACVVVPPSGMLFAISSSGVVSRWRYRNSRSGVQRGWHLQCQSHIGQQTENAISCSLISKPPFITTHDPANSHIDFPIMSEPYAFQVSHDCEAMLIATAAGLLLWDVETFRITGGHCAATISDASSKSSFYSALCFSPTASAVFALSDKGFVHAFSLVSPIVQTLAETSASGTIVTASRLVDITHADGIHGGWDIIASIASEGPSAASTVVDALTYGMIRTPGPILPNASRISSAKSMLRGLLNSDDAMAIAAKRLLEVAVEAIETSAMDSVKPSLQCDVVDVKSLSSSKNVSKIVNRTIMSTSFISSTQLVAAPLADWIITLCCVWLQRCAQVLSNYDPKGGILQAPWVAVVSMIPPNDRVASPGHGIVYDLGLLHDLWPASLSALLLLAIDARFVKHKVALRRHRFSLEDANCVFAAFWDVSHTWACACTSDQSIESDTKPFSPPVLTERMLNAGVVMGKHLKAANILSDTKELCSGYAERSLGLRGSAKNAGFVTSCQRYHGNRKGGSRSSNYIDESTDWCPYDILTGEPLSFERPLRQCVSSGLFSAYIPDIQGKSGAFPWVKKWETRSPLGGPWAIVKYQVLSQTTQSRSTQLNAVQDPSKIESSDKTHQLSTYANIQQVKSDFVQNPLRHFSSADHMASGNLFEHANDNNSGPPMQELSNGSLEPCGSRHRFVDIMKKSVNSTKSLIDKNGSCLVRGKRLNECGDLVGAPVKKTPRGLPGQCQSQKEATFDRLSANVSFHQYVSNQPESCYGKAMKPQHGGNKVDQPLSSSLCVPLDLSTVPYTNRLVHDHQTPTRPLMGTCAKSSTSLIYNTNKYHSTSPSLEEEWPQLSFPNDGHLKTTISLPDDLATDEHQKSSLSADFTNNESNGSTSSSQAQSGLATHALAQNCSTPMLTMAQRRGTSSTGNRGQVENTSDAGSKGDFFRSQYVEQGINFENMPRPVQNNEQGLAPTKGRSNDCDAGVGAGSNSNAAQNQNAEAPMHIPPNLRSSRSCSGDVYNFEIEPLGTKCSGSTIIAQGVNILDSKWMEFCGSEDVEKSFEESLFQYLQQNN